MKHSRGGTKQGGIRTRFVAIGLTAAAASLLGGCVSQATYEEAVQDARQAREGAARYEASQRDVKISDLQAQMLTATIQFQSELRRQAEAQQNLANELLRLRQTSEGSHHGEGAGNEQALQERIRDLEKQQKAMATRAEELEAEIMRMQMNPKANQPKKGPIRAVELDLIDPWQWGESRR